MLKVTIFGAGYVGLVTGVCLAEIGHDVLCVDVDENKIAMLNQGKSPIHEPGLDELLQRNQQHGRLHFSSNMERAVHHGEFLCIAVGTPAAEDGAADLSAVVDVATSIGRHMNHDCLLVNKSTVPVGTAHKIKAVIQQHLEQRHVHYSFGVTSNPEFLKQGDAIQDFMHSDRIVIGTDKADDFEHLLQLYEPLIKDHQSIISMSVASAELTKYAANSFLATKISFMNELSRLAEKVGADIEEIKLGIGSDQRIGPHFLNPGCGYGGSCFPKDVNALIQAAREHDCKLQLLQAVEDVNQQQKLILFEKIKNYFEGDLSQRTIALWGLSFKPDTDDVRDASSRVLMELLWDAGATVRAYDPIAIPEINRLYPDRKDLHLVNSSHEALAGADALAIVTEWSEFRNPDFAMIKSSLNQSVIFDGRNLYNPTEMAELGLEYFAIGRGMASEE